VHDSRESRDATRREAERTRGYVDMAKKDTSAAYFAGGSKLIGGGGLEVNLF
jgi:hypothetical protein